MADLWKIAFALDCHRKSLELRAKAKAKACGSPDAPSFWKQELLGMAAVVVLFFVCVDLLLKLFE